LHRASRPRRSLIAAAAMSSLECPQCGTGPPDVLDPDDFCAAVLYAFDERDQPYATVIRDREQKFSIRDDCSRQRTTRFARRAGNPSCCRPPQPDGALWHILSHHCCRSLGDQAKAIARLWPRRRRAAALTPELPPHLSHLAPHRLGLLARRALPHAASSRAASPAESRAAATS
jgi:hypothetical protein